MQLRSKAMLAGVLAVIAVVAFLLFSATTTISSADMTATRLRVLEFRIRQYVQKEGHKVPADLNTLPKTPNKDNSITDGWGRQFILIIDDSVITLTSYGKDGEPGGTGDNADVVHRFSLESPVNNGTRVREMRLN